MTLKQLQTFYWVCRLGGFSTAAKRLFTSQSAVSMRIHDLEASLGVALFDRSQRMSKLTAKGRELLKHVEQLVSFMAELEASVGNPKVLSGNVRLGVTELVAVTWLPQLVAAIQHTYPEIILELDVDVALKQIEKLRKGDLDVALGPGPVAEPGLATVSLGTVEFAWMASPKLDLPRGRISPADIRAITLLAPPRSSKLYELLDVWLSESHTTIWRTYVCNSIGVLAALTVAGLGISYLPHRTYKREIDAGVLSLLDIQPAMPHLEYFAVFEKRRAQPLAQAIAELAGQTSQWSGKSGRRARGRGRAMAEKRKR
jgi:DNA-binding transcriptional LysR family regulator